MSLETIDNRLQRSAVVLVRPQIPDNIGAAARAVRNMGLGGLIVVRPKRWNLDRMCSLAVRTGSDLILNDLVVAADLESAVKDFGLVIGTSARTGKFRKPAGPPRRIMAGAAELIDRGRVALVFGPEDKGLTTDDLNYCDRLVRIPVSPRASSVNLAQSVMIMAYELRLAVAELDAPARRPGPKLADSAELQGMYDHLQATLEEIDPTRHHNIRVWMDAFRSIFGRSDLAPHEVRLIRGLCRKISWAARKTAPETGWEANG